MHTNQAAGGGDTVGDGFREEIESLATATHSEPFQILGPHWIERDGKQALVIRAFRPGAREARIRWRRRPARFVATLIHPDGLFEALLPMETPGLIPGQPVSPSAYSLEFVFADGSQTEVQDPYA